MFIRALGPRRLGHQSHSASELASVLNLQGRWEEAAKTYAELDQATASWPAARKEGIGLSTNLINTLYATNNMQAGLTAAERLLERQKGRFGDQHSRPPSPAAYLPSVLAEADREQMPSASSSWPFRCWPARRTRATSTMRSAARHAISAWLSVMESYMGLLPAQGDTGSGREGFKFADMVRGRAVERALAASGARAVARNPALAEQARRLAGSREAVAAQLGAVQWRAQLSFIRARRAVR